ncbi:MAG: hypothetical protein ACOYL3_20940 [Desulfuromonadaceae bacterium]
MRPELLGSYVHKRLHGGVIATALDTVGGFAVAVAVAEKYASETVEQIVARFSRFGTIDFLKMNLALMNQCVLLLTM